MYRIDGIVPIEIDCGPGIYCLRYESSTGKTYLYSAIKKYAAKMNVAAVTYWDIKKGADVLGLIGHNRELVVLDRYDLYQKEGQLAEILKNNPTAIILVDSKTGIHERELGTQAELASIKISDTGKICVI